MDRTVHIVPLGHEIDRAVAPFELPEERGGLVAHRVHLLRIHPGDLPRGGGKTEEKLVGEQPLYTGAVKKRLLAAGVREVREVPVDPFRMDEIAARIAAIVVEERKRGNLVRINMSAAGKLAAVAATLVAMAHGVEAYYVVAREYPTAGGERKTHGLSASRGEVVPLEVTSLGVPTFALPDPPAQRVLCEMGRKGQVSSADLWALLRSAGLARDPQSTGHRVRNEAARRGMAIKHFAEKFRRELSKEERGRENIYRLSEYGEFVVRLCGEPHLSQKPAPSP
ncbi:MAG: DUF6293 family protein [Halobacteria archaeon]